MTKPCSLNPLAVEILNRLSAHSEASEIVLGGYFALQHYADYRQTYDIDAWWKTRASTATENAIRTVMADVATAQELELHERSFGDTVSFELHRAKVKEFSFQIALRSISIEEPITSAWPPILIETLQDNVGSKMNALVNRGAPRDLVDIKHVVDERLLSVEDSWALWTKKNPGQTVESAKQNVLLHLKRLEARRPLDTINDPHEREQAKNLRAWYRSTFLK
jgi:hypothetical protein